MRQKLLAELFDLEHQATAGEIIFYRFFELVVVLWTITFAWRWGLYLSRIADVVLPLGIARYLDVSFMFDHNLGVVNAALMTLAMMLGYLRLWRHAYLVGLLLFHLQYVSRYSQGEISHGSNVVGMALLAIAAAMLVFKSQTESRRVALGLCYFFFGLGYTSAAFCKLVGTGLEWPDGRHLWMWIQERTVDTFSERGAVEYNWLQTLSLDHHVVATMILLFGLLVELFAFVMWFRRFRPVIMTLLAGMHVGIWIALRVSFNANVCLLLILAYPWAAFLDRALTRWHIVRFDS